MKYTNLNISNSEDSFKYIAEYNEQDTVGNYQFVVNDKNIVFLYDADITDDSWKWNRLIKNGNEWGFYDEDTYGLTHAWDEYITTHRLSNITIYYPQFSVDTYENGVKYILDVSLNIHGHTVVLGSFLLNRNDAIACKPQHFLNNEYFEKYTIVIPNPFDILYSSEWKSFRNVVCGCVNIDDDFENNDDGPTLNCVLTAVDFVDGRYIKKNHYNNCQNFIDITEQNDLFNIQLTHTLNDENDKFEFIVQPNVNSVYDDIIEYITETYGFTPTKLKSEIVVQDNENIYKQSIKDEITTINHDPIIFDIFDDDLYFDDWSEFKWGLFVNATLSIYKDSDEELLFLKSNSISISPELYRFMIKDDNINIQQINLNDIEMNQINVVNKNVKQIIQSDVVNDGKTMFVKPLFYRTQLLPNIVIHPEVTEVTCINLDAYKSGVEQFRIQIENTIFVEIGRNNSGVLFKVVGSKLPKERESGTYYILNDDEIVITSGKYIYEY